MEDCDWIKALKTLWLARAGQVGKGQRRRMFSVDWSNRPRNCPGCGGLSNSSNAWTPTGAPNSDLLPWKCELSLEVSCYLEVIIHDILRTKNCEDQLLPFERDTEFSKKEIAKQSGPHRKDQYQSTRKPKAVSERTTEPQCYYPWLTNNIWFLSLTKCGKFSHLIVSL